jgi:hypothetical protein
MDEAGVMAEYFEKSKVILDRAASASKSPADPRMVYPELRAALARLQRETAEKLGKTKEDLAPRFKAEDEKLKETLGV